MILSCGQPLPSPDGYRARTTSRRNSHDFPTSQFCNQAASRPEVRLPSHATYCSLVFAGCSERRQHLVLGLVLDDQGNRCCKTFNIKTFNIKTFNVETFNMKGACAMKIQIRNAGNTRSALRDIDQSDDIRDCPTDVPPHRSLPLFRQQRD